MNIMIIKKSEQLRYNIGFNAFFPFKPQIQAPLSLINTFFIYAYRYIRNDDNLIFMQKIEKILLYGMNFENNSVDIDTLNNLVYISDVYYDKNKPTTDEIEKLLDEENKIELCKIGFLEHVILTKENFLHIILSWDKAINQQSPFALLYEDNKGWYDVLPFDSQEAMEKFVTDHTGDSQEDTQKQAGNSKVTKIITIIIVFLLLLIRIMKLG